MEELWTQERVLALAPDPASAKAGQGLCSPRKWVSLGRNESAVWGECQGSGAKPYQVQVDLREVAFKCSCPSRKFPCKHGIGLMLIHADGGVTAEEAPEWVKQWLDSRAQRQAKKAEKTVEVSPEKLVERAESQAQRREKRLGRVMQGMEELGVWLEDMVRSGLAAAPGKGFGYFDERAKRLVDAQAPGAARMVTEIGSAAVSGQGWQRRVLERAGLAYLLTRATAKIEEMPEGLKEDVLAALGVPVAKEMLEAQPAVKDVWQVIGREVEIEANLKAQRTHLFGLTTQRPALLLDFAFGASGLDGSVPLGTLFPAELAFYPGHSIRAVVKVRGEDVAPLTDLHGFESLGAMLDAHATLLAEQPWLGEIGVPVKGLTPVLEEGRWIVVDQMGDALPMSVRGRSGWVALACSGGAAAAMGVCTDGRGVRPLSMIAENAFVDLAAVGQQEGQG
jgi:hypothetical protein